MMHGIKKNMPNKLIDLNEKILLRKRNIIETVFDYLKNKIKCWLGKKAYTFYSLGEINDKLLSTIILNFRNNPYALTFDREKEKYQAC